MKKSKSKRLGWLPIEQANEKIKQINLKDLKGRIITEEELKIRRGANNLNLLVP